MTIRLGVLLSGSGSNLQAIVDHVAAGSLDAEVRLVLSNKPDAYGLVRAARAGVPTACVEQRCFPRREDFDAEVVRLLREAGVEYVAMAGFMRIVTPVFLNAFVGRVLNIHPSLLPACTGIHAQRQQVEHGVRLGGCTVHFVDEELDHGPVIIQAAVPAYSDDAEQTLAERILAMEHRIYPQALQWLAQGRIRLDGRQVIVAHALREGGRFWTNPPLEHPFDR